MSYKGLKQAANAAGVDRSTIYRAIKSGKISAIKDEFGAFDIDPAELHRVFPPVSSDEFHNREKKQNDTGNLSSENSVLLNTVEHLRELMRQIESERDDLRKRLDKTEEERREDKNKFTALLLIHQQPAEQIESERAERERLLKVIEEQAGSYKQLTQKPAEPIKNNATLVAWVLGVVFLVATIGGALWVWFQNHAALV
jgi:predicted  nucleic acid-binding Zn-ribbon protein